MADDDLSAEDIDLATWFTPLQAFAYAARILSQDDAAAAIWERLRGGLITAIAATSSATLRGRSPVAKTEPSFIPVGHWDNFSGKVGANFWHSGDARFFLPPTRHRDLPLTIRCFGIRLDPANVRATLPPLPPEQPKQASEVVPTTEQAKTEPLPAVRGPGPPVPDAVLRAWYELYRKAYQGSADTLENALNSARGMFPGKFVSRERVRNLVGGRKRGRKSREPAQ
jgi:hypothetical protein